MKGLALAVAGAAAIALTACTHDPTHSAAASSHGASVSKLTAPVSCGHQYRTWNSGDGKGVMDALRAVTSAASARDARVLTSALHLATPAVAKAAKHPIPACADPSGYWNVLLMHVNAAAASKTSTSNVRAAMQDVPKIHSKLVDEVKQIAQ